MKLSPLPNIALQIVSDISTLRQALKAQTSIAFVPTMGNLHDGHLALVALAKQHAACVVVSIFVNPLQFGENEDFNAYPRTLEQDQNKLRGAGVDIVFSPQHTEIFSDRQEFYIQPPSIASDLCGKFRPGHFQGVATILAKLFNIIQPHIAVFGKKDYQQLTIVKGMVEQLNFAIDVVAAETVRAKDGLALSSRNIFLEENVRTQAAAMYGVLMEFKNALLEGKQDFAGMEHAASQTLVDLGWRIDYISVRHAESLASATRQDKRLVVLAAGWLGHTRLIDNVEVDL